MPNYVVTKQTADGFIDVEVEVAVRKYEVDSKRLCECLRTHKEAANLGNREIAERLNRPITEVEHWFRMDNCFSIPASEIWFKIKELLDINTEEFDQSIMEFEFKGGNYDMRNRIYMGDTAPTLTCGCGNNLHLLPEDHPVICVQGNIADRAESVNCNGSGWSEDKAYTLNTVDKHVVVYGEPQYIVRRLTPLECERLQGYPDYWTDIGEYTDTSGKKKKSSDAARYKALGNSIALPPWKWVLKRLCSHYERDATLLSLFDGIGGFPLIWEGLNGKGTALGASEIEDFPIAVTKARIG
jgi:site-specific DNA-cytosine methylase